MRDNIVELWNTQSAVAMVPTDLVGGLFNHARTIGTGWGWDSGLIRNTKDVFNYHGISVREHEFGLSVDGYIGQLHTLEKFINTYAEHFKSGSMFVADNNEKGLRFVYNILNGVVTRTEHVL